MTTVYSCMHSYVYMEKLRNKKTVLGFVVSSSVYRWLWFAVRKMRVIVKLKCFTMSNTCDLKHTKINWNISLIGIVLDSNPLSFPHLFAMSLGKHALVAALVL